MGNTKNKRKYGWMCGGCRAETWNEPPNESCYRCGMQRKEARQLWFAKLKRFWKAAEKRANRRR